MENLEEILKIVDDFVWGPVMLVLLVGTGIFLTFRLKFLTWKNLPYAIRLTLSKESRTKNGAGDVSPFAALTTALAATIGTGNIIGVATAMVSGGAGALVWMWISACFGLTSKFSECMLAIKYREVNAQGEMSVYDEKSDQKQNAWSRSGYAVCLVCGNCVLWNRQSDTGKFHFRRDACYFWSADMADRDHRYRAFTLYYCRRD